jgi:cell division protein FtsQ
MKPVFKYILISISAILVILYLVFSLWYFSRKNKELVCTSFEIVLTDFDKIQLISQQDIAVILDQNSLNPIGRSMNDICSEDIEVQILKNKMIKTAECFKSPSGTVHVSISQRCPKFRVVGFESYYIDTDRKPMPVSLNYAAYVPVVSGKITKSLAMGQIFDFVTYIEENPFWNAQIEQIFVRDDLKIELVPRVGDATILLGNLDNFEMRLNKLHKLYINGFNVIGWNRYKYIDLQYKDQVVCSKMDVKLTKPIRIVVDTILKTDSIIAKKI